MVAEIPIRCRCGTLRGALTDITPAVCNHVVCYCRDCRAFARFLGPDGVLDPHGGTPIVQTSPSRVRLDAGLDQLRCMRLSDKGLLRWYSACCRTPVGNMVSAGVPFIGLPTACLPDVTEAQVGPAVGIQAASAVTSETQGRPLGAHEGVPMRLIGRTAMALLRGWVGGDHRASPFFDRETRAPIATPEVMDPEARARLREA